MAIEIFFIKKATHVGSFKDSAGRHTRAGNIKEDASLKLGSVSWESHRSKPSPHTRGAVTSWLSAAPPNTNLTVRSEGSTSQTMSNGMILLRKDNEPLLAQPAPRERGK